MNPFDQSFTKRERTWLRRFVTACSFGGWAVLDLIEEDREFAESLAKKIGVKVEP